MNFKDCYRVNYITTPSGETFRSCSIAYIRNEEHEYDETTEFHIERIVFNPVRGTFYAVNYDGKVINLHLLKSKGNET